MYKTENDAAGFRSVREMERFGKAWGLMQLTNLDAETIDEPVAAACAEWANNQLNQMKLAHGWNTHHTYDDFKSWWIENNQ